MLSSAARAMPLTPRAISVSTAATCSSMAPCPDTLCTSGVRPCFLAWASASAERDAMKVSLITVFGRMPMTGPSAACAT